MSYLSGTSCAQVADKVLYAALLDYYCDRGRWVADERTGRMRPRAQHRIGICAVCGTALAEHFCNPATATFLGPEAPEYAAVRETVVEGYRNGTPCAWLALPLCPEAMTRWRPHRDVRVGTNGNEHRLRLSDAAFEKAAEVLRAERKRVGDHDDEPDPKAAPAPRSRDSLKKP